MTARNQDLYGLILAGGFSKRMGKDKALLEFNGKPQVIHAHDLLSTFCSKVFISTRLGQSYFSLPLLEDLPQYADAGPAAGIVSAMERYPNVSWVVLACDLPFVSQGTIAHLLNLRNPQKIATAFLSSHDGLPEPLCAIWEGKAKNDIIRFLSENTYCPRKMLIKSNVELILLPEKRWLHNVNAPQDFP